VKRASREPARKSVMMDTMKQGRSRYNKRSPLGTFRPKQEGYGSSTPTRVRLPQDLLSKWEGMDPDEKSRLVEEALKSRDAA
jgi:hypothetical protein